MENLLQPENLILYLLGFIVFACTILDHFVNKRRKVKSIAYYIQEGLYTFIMIAAGIALGIHFEFSDAINKLVAILMGIIGPTLIRKIGNNKDTFADTILDMLKSKFVKSKNENNGK